VAVADEFSNTMEGFNCELNGEEYDVPDNYSGTLTQR